MRWRIVALLEATWRAILGWVPRNVPPRPGLRSRHQTFHQELSSEAASSSLQMKAAVSAKIARVEEEVHTNETMDDLNEAREELDRVRKLGQILGR